MLKVGTSTSRARHPASGAMPSLSRDTNPKFERHFRSDSCGDGREKLPQSHLSTLQQRRSTSDRTRTKLANVPGEVVINTLRVLHRPDTSTFAPLYKTYKTPWNLQPSIKASKCGEDRREPTWPHRVVDDPTLRSDWHSPCTRQPRTSHQPCLLVRLVENMKRVRLVLAVCSNRLR